MCNCFFAGILAVDALRKGLADLSDICDHVQGKFEVLLNYIKPLKTTRISCVCIHKPFPNNISFLINLARVSAVSTCRSGITGFLPSVHCFQRLFRCFHLFLFFRQQLIILKNKR